MSAALPSPQETQQLPRDRASCTSRTSTQPWPGPPPPSPYGMGHGRPRASFGPVRVQHRLSRYIAHGCVPRPRPSHSADSARPWHQLDLWGQPPCRYVNSAAPLSLQQAIPEFTWPVSGDHRLLAAERNPPVAHHEERPVRILLTQPAELTLRPWLLPECGRWVRTVAHGASSSRVEGSSAKPSRPAWSGCHPRCGDACAWDSSDAESAMCAGASRASSGESTLLPHAAASPS